MSSPSDVDVADPSTMSSSSSDHVLAHTNSSEFVTFDNIIKKKLIAELLKSISEAQKYIKPKSGEDNNINTSTNTNTNTNINTTNTISNTTANTNTNNTISNTTATSINTSPNTDTTSTNTNNTISNTNATSINTSPNTDTTSTNTNTTNSKADATGKTGSSINCFGSTNTTTTTVTKAATNANINTTNSEADATGNNGSSINCFGGTNNTTTNTTVTKAATNANINTSNNDGTPKSDTSKNPNEKLNNNNNNNNNSENRSRHLYGRLENLRIDLDYVQTSFNNLREYEEHVANPFGDVSSSVNDIVTEIKEHPSDSLLENKAFLSKLRGLEKDMMNLKVHIPSAHKMYSSANNSEAQHFTAPSAHGYNAPKTMGGLPVLSMSENFQSSSAYNDFQEIYNSLDFNSKLCLLCFSVFPINAVVKRRILMYWWIGEGLIVPEQHEKTVEEVADDILLKLAEKGLIQPVNKQHRAAADSFSMHPLIRSAVITRAKKVDFLDFDDQGNPTANFESCRTACLFGRGSSFQLSSEKNKESDDAGGKKREEEEEEEARKKVADSSSNGRKREDERKNSQLKHEKLYTLYNVNEEYLKFEPEWFLKLKNVHVLQVGKWMSSAENHIEVEDIEFLKKLKNMKLLMYFSLQGISRISELPETIGGLTNLRIMDLRACHNLETLPEEIGALKNLTHLDMSECYLLDNMPHGIALLIQLEVLKGFVIGDRKKKARCDLTDLKRLTKLRKLTISTSLKTFPTEADLNDLHKFEALRKLKIAWGGSSDSEVVAEPMPNPSIMRRLETLRGVNPAKPSTNQLQTPKPSTNKLQKPKPSFKNLQKSITLKNIATMVTGGSVNPEIPEIAALPIALEKLDLQCFPHTKTPIWLKPSKLTSLKKLYIRGGNLSDLPDSETDHKWEEVTILRLKYLYELVKDWTQLEASFPKLTYLEMVKCPKLTFCPCDDAGVWRKK